MLQYSHHLANFNFFQSIELHGFRNIVKNYKERGTLEGNYPGRQPKITKEQRKAMIKLVKERPDITINEIIEELQLPIKKSRVSKILLEEKMYLKKSKFVQQNGKTKK